MADSGVVCGHQVQRRRVHVLLEAASQIGFQLLQGECHGHSPLGVPFGAEDTGPAIVSFACDELSRGVEFTAAHLASDALSENIQRDPTGHPAMWTGQLRPYAKQPLRDEIRKDVRRS